MTRARNLAAHVRHAAWVTGYAAWLLATGWRDRDDQP
jgi:hypothetical protein